MQQAIIFIVAGSWLLSKTTEQIRQQGYITAAPSWRVFHHDGILAVVSHDLIMGHVFHHGRILAVISHDLIMGHVIHHDLSMGEIYITALSIMT